MNYVGISRSLNLLHDFFDQLESDARENVNNFRTFQNPANILNNLNRSFNTSLNDFTDIQNNVAALQNGDQRRELQASVSSVQGVIDSINFAVGVFSQMVNERQVQPRQLNATSAPAA